MFIEFMCYTCGCKLPYDDHGDPKNIVEEPLVQAGETEAIAKAGRKTAKENMMELIGLEEKMGELGNPRQDYNGVENEKAGNPPIGDQS
jgi:hypothetical protein